MAAASGAPSWALRRLGVLMRPDPSDPREAWGVLNPACARGRDGQLYLFPRLVAEGNFSRVGRARVLFDADETPAAVERLGVVLEPDETWETNATTAGVEDPRITFIPSLDLYVMTYAAFGPLHSRIGLAFSNDLERWERLGPAWFAYEPALRADLNLYTNKVLWRTPSALLDPQTPQERDGIVPNVVFPTGIDPRGDGDADVFYGMADSRIGVARLHRTGAAQ